MIDEKNSNGCRSIREVGEIWSQIFDPSADEDWRTITGDEAGKREMNGLYCRDNVGYYIRDAL